VLERRPAIEAEAGHPKYRKLDREHLSLFAGRVVPRGVVNRSHSAVWKGLSVEPGGSLCGAVIPGPCTAAEPDVARRTRNLDQRARSVNNKR
jgi:hypothetical protein